MKVLFIDTTHPLLPELLTNAGFNVTQSKFNNKTELLEHINQYSGVIVRSKFIIDEEFFSKATNLKFIGRVGAGLENIDLVSAEKHEVKVYNSPEGNRDAVGEQAIGMLLSLQNNLIRANKEVREGKWNREKNRGFEIKGKTIGIIGFGNMGSTFAKKLQGFETNILAYDKYKQNYAPEYVNETTLENLLLNSDIISLHVPLTAETKFMINDEFIPKCKDSVVIINTARGKVLNTEALVKGLQTGKVSGACLDVLEYESTSFENLFAGQIPKAFEYLKQSEQVILSPHIAGWTHESNIKLSKILAEKIILDFKI